MLFLDLQVARANIITIGVCYGRLTGNMGRMRDVRVQHIERRMRISREEDLAGQGASDYLIR